MSHEDFRLHFLFHCGQHSHLPIITVPAENKTLHVSSAVKAKLGEDELLRRQLPSETVPTFDCSVLDRREQLSQHLGDFDHLNVW